MSTNTGAIKLDLFKKLMASLQDSTKDSMHPAVPPVLAMVRDETKDLMEKLEIATKKISIDELKDESFVWYQDGLATKTRKDSKKEDTRDKTLVVDTNDLTATTGAVFNWLIKTLNVCVEKLNSHSIVLDAMLIHHEQDVVKLKDENNKVEEKCGELKEENEKVVVEVEKLKEEKVNVETRCERLEVEKDEVQQRGMKGNLIISTNTRGGRASGFQRLPPSGPNMEVESKLSDVLLVLKYVQNKDVFMRYHKAHLTRRLILDTSADSEKEENMVEWLREVRQGNLLKSTNLVFRSGCRPTS